MSVPCHGAEGGTRTRTESPPRDFKSLASTIPPLRLFLEAPPRLGLGNKGFADLCLTTWLWCHNAIYYDMCARNATYTIIFAFPVRLPHREFEERETGCPSSLGDLRFASVRSHGGSDADASATNVAESRMEHLWSGRRDSDPRHLPWQGNALPLSHSRA